MILSSPATPRRAVLHVDPRARDRGDQLRPGASGA
jgi:excinuclease UvrABC ATPase subunit